MELNSELRYRIRAKAQLLCAEADMIYELRTHIHAYLDNPCDPASYKKAEVLLETLSSLTDRASLATKEIQGDMAELNKKLISH
jgi:hypothetical protein